jgi:hypothetical protein
MKRLNLSSRQVVFTLLVIVAALFNAFSIVNIKAQVLSREDNRLPQDEDSFWWSAGDKRVFPASSEYPNPWGRLGLVNAEGIIQTDDHPFFQALGVNGRGCVTCHQPADAMSLSLTTIQERWDITKGHDPLFSSIDGMNCPNLSPADPNSHSLLLKRGLFRIALPWPPVGVEPEFTLEVVRDPSGCNTDPVFGINGERREISVYRRPRSVMNTRYVVSSRFGVSAFVGKTGELAAIDPDTGKPQNMNMMADARVVTPKTQAKAAAADHMGVILSNDQLNKIRDFELQLYGAQIWSTLGGNLQEQDGPTGLGPKAMVNGRDGVLGNNTTSYVFPMENRWVELVDGYTKEDESLIEMRKSIQRGHDVFFYRTFWIKDAMHINTVGLGNPIKRTCATCHGMHLTGMDTANGWMDLGTTNLPWALEPPQSPWATGEAPMPLFKVTCRSDLPPHPFLGRTIYTQDPGRALISGKCEDVGAIVIQQFRGLSARAPYFSNGSASTLRELVDFYDRRFNIQYSEQEKVDLVNFMSAL